MGGLFRAGFVLATALAMAGCATTRKSAPPPAPPAPPPAAKPVEPPKPAAPPPPKTAVQAGVKAGPPVSSLDLSPEAATAARDSFRTSCRVLLRRNDASGLTRNADWQPACTAAAATDVDPVLFFQQQFETVVVGSGATHITGYYEPEIEGSRVRTDEYAVPVYRKPPDLVEVDPGAASGRPTGKKQRGRLDANGQFQLYYDRAEIDGGALAGKGLEIGYAKDPVEFFFLQIQGSGRLILPDGSVMRIGYDGQNGREYVGIGKLMRDRGLVGPGTSYETSMQGLMAYMRDHPDQLRPLLEVNKSFVFFRELIGPGPLGALGVPVVGHVSVAADPMFVPLGAPVWLSVDRPEANGLWVAQDTGGAIKGANRFDTFWGAGVVARITAGGMSARGQALILVPRGTIERVTAPNAPGA